MRALDCHQFSNLVHDEVAGLLILPSSWLFSVEEVEVGSSWREVGRVCGDAGFDWLGRVVSVESRFAVRIIFK